jgi:hypothetical protein
MVQWALLAQQLCGWTPVTLAFLMPDSRGTLDMARRCKAAGIPGAMIHSSRKA